MTIKKNTDLEFSLQKGTEKGGVYTNFYTEDKGSASIRIRLSSNGYYLDLTKTDLKPVLFLFHEDGSIFEIRDFINVMPDKGLIQYNLSDNVIVHAGKVKAKLFLKNTEQSVHVANFTFDIKDSGIEGAVAKEVNVNIVDDAVRRIVKENAIEILDDGFKDDVSVELKNYVNDNVETFKGPRGEKGEQGIRGPKGDKGEKGTTGKGVDDIALQNVLYNRLYGSLSEYKVPETLNVKPPFNIMTALNGTVKADYNVTNRKNKVVSRYYVDVKNGNNDNDGSESKPFQTLNRAFRYDPVDEIVIKSGIYGWSNGEGETSVRWENASFNLIGDGEVYLGAHREGQQWTPVSNTNNVYSTVASSVIEIIDLNDGYESPIFYKKMKSIEEVEKNKSSYFIGSGNTIYVNPKHTGTPNEKILLNMRNNALKLNDKNKVYLENINFTNTLLVENSTPGELYAKNCKFAYGTSDNAVSIKGDVYFELQNCNSMWATLDGFNYHVHNGKLPKGIELDCKSFNNGRDGADQNNGSTMHDGGKILRIGGEYYSNQGPNVIDVNEGTVSVNIGVYAHDSKATKQTVSNSNFKNGNLGLSKMFLVNCISSGSDYSVVTATSQNAVSTIDNCLLIETQGTV